jgi:hypothetical protein
MGVACSTHEKKRNAYEILMGKPIGWRIIVKWIVEKQDGAVWTRFIWLRIGTNGELLLIR